MDITIKNYEGFLSQIYKLFYNNNNILYLSAGNEDSIYNLCGRNDFNEYVANVSDKVQELQVEFIFKLFVSIFIIHFLILKLMGCYVI